MAVYYLTNQLASISHMPPSMNDSRRLRASCAKSSNEKSTDTFPGITGLCDDSDNVRTKYVGEAERKEKKKGKREKKITTEEKLKQDDASNLAFFAPLPQPPTQETMCRHMQKRYSVESVRLLKLIDKRKVTPISCLPRVSSPSGAPPSPHDSPPPCRLTSVSCCRPQPPRGERSPPCPSPSIRIKRNSMVKSQNSHTERRAVTLLAHFALGVAPHPLSPSSNVSTKFGGFGVAIKYMRGPPDA